MCSISGVFQKNSSNAYVHDLSKKMNSILVHRGPDKSSTYLDNSIPFSMGMNRLSIMDISSGDQPFISKDGRYSLIFNGEIINANEIRKKLIKEKNINFLSKNSDTEVLFNYLIHMNGLNNLQYLNGMFAFAFYDSFKKKIYLARDRFGIKPLFYSKSNNNFYFASEIKALKKISDINLDLDNESICDYLSLMYVANNKTIYKSIKKLPSGSLLQYDCLNDDLQISKWFSFSFSKNLSDKINFQEIEDLLIYKIEDAVKKWKISDVPISCSLSGGLDSSIITKIISKHSNTVNTFTLGFDEKDIDDELGAAAEIAKICKTNHHEIKINTSQLINEIPSIIHSLDEPYGGGLPSWFIYKHASKNFKVILTGTGADELFGDYGKWIYLDKISYFKLDKISYFFNKFYFNRNNYFTYSEKKKILNSDIFLENKIEKIFFEKYKSNFANNPIDKTSLIDLEGQLQDEFLQMTDRFSMAHSIEARPCFLENELVDFALSIPAHIRTKTFNTKYLLRNISKKYFSREISQRPKQGFVLPISRWINNFFYKEFEKLFSVERVLKQNIFNKNILIDYINPSLNELKKNDKNAKIATKLWALLMFQLWYVNK
jgi:asparagine synthase (glutamine-hydrolysing)